MNKKIFRDFHIYLSLFFLPVALLYVISGVAYICGFNQDVDMKKEIFKLDVNYKKGDEKEFILNFLKEHNLKIPKNTKVVFDKKLKAYRMGISNYTVLLKENELITRKRSILGNLIMLHKNKCAWYFNILAFGFSITLAMLYISGLIISLTKKNKIKQIFTIILGFIVTFVICYISV